MVLYPGNGPGSDKATKSNRRMNILQENENYFSCQKVIVPARFHLTPLLYGDYYRRRSLFVTIDTISARLHLKYEPAFHHPLSATDMAF